MVGIFKESSRNYVYSKHRRLKERKDGANNESGTGGEHLGNKVGQPAKKGDNIEQLF